MKEHKYRAWDKQGKRMLEVRGLTWTRRDTALGEPPVIDMIVAFGETFTFEPESVDLIACTGLKDKNGVGIWEGDIVSDKILDHKTKKPESEARIFEVYWDEKTASFWQKLVDDPDRKFRSGHCFAAEKDCEVIGNIHENPELLTA